MFRGIIFVAAASLNLATDPCCLSCVDNTTKKYYSIDHIFNHCGESCIKPGDYNLYHLFEPGLKPANSSHPCLDLGYPTYDETETHGFGPIKVTVDLYNQKKMETEAPQPQCCATCTDPATKKYYSIDHIFNHCGESCIKPGDYNLYHLFEPGLKPANSSHPCLDLGYPVYDETETHGFGPIKVTVDLYNQKKMETEAQPQCCVTCTDSSTKKYYSIDTTHNKCGESCIEPSKYNLYHIFEKGLKAASSSTPCSDLGYTKYDETETHGFGPIKVTVDLYDPSQ